MSMNLGEEMTLSSLYGMLDLLTNADDDINPDTVRNVAVLGLMLVSDLKEEYERRLTEGARVVSIGGAR